MPADLKKKLPGQRRAFYYGSKNFQRNLIEKDLQTVHSNRLRPEENGLNFLGLLILTASLFYLGFVIWQCYKKYIEKLTKKQKSSYPTPPSKKSSKNPQTHVEKSEKDIKEEKKYIQLLENLSDYIEQSQQTAVEYPKKESISCEKIKTRKIKPGTQTGRNKVKNMQHTTPPRENPESIKTPRISVEEKKEQETAIHKENAYEFNGTTYEINEKLFKNLTREKQNFLTETLSKPHENTFKKFTLSDKKNKKKNKFLSGLSKNSGNLVFTKIRSSNDVRFFGVEKKSDRFEIFAVQEKHKGQITYYPIQSIR